ncbi:MAG: TetR/AcrR family transcriptional regulator [bacterium]|nr:TetR/AcrR family transcriptional regulator [bacterium]
MKMKGFKKKEMVWRRQEVLAMARKVFTKKGFHHSTMDDIAAAIGISKGAVYLYFPSKEKLFMDIIEQGLRGRTEMLKEIVNKNTDCLSKIKEYISQAFVYMENNRDLVQMFMMVERDLVCSDLHQKLHGQAIKEMERSIEYLTAIIRQGVKERLLKDIDPENIALGLSGIIQMFIMRAMFQKMTKSLEKEKSFILEAFLEGVKA